MGSASLAFPREHRETHLVVAAACSDSQLNRGLGFLPSSFYTWRPARSLSLTDSSHNPRGLLCTAQPS